MWMTEQELLDELRISPSTLYTLRCKDEILKKVPTVKRNGRRVYLKSEIEQWIKLRQSKVENAYLSRKITLEKYRAKKKLTGIDSKHIIHK